MRGTERHRKRNRRGGRSPDERQCKLEFEQWLWDAEERTKQRLNKYLHYIVSVVIFLLFYLNINGVFSRI